VFVADRQLQVIERRGVAPHPVVDQRAEEAEQVGLVAVGKPEILDLRAEIAAARRGRQRIALAERPGARRVAAGDLPSPLRL
jgi:hypothetical protein